MKRSRDPILQRIERDIQRGDYALARDRLSSHLATLGYEPERIARLAQICFDMHDLFQAGRLWLVSNAAGPHVEQAIEVFLQRCGNRPAVAASHLPRFCRQHELASYPSDVQARLKARGLESAVLLPATRTAVPQSFRARIVEKGMITGCLIVLVLGVACSVAGAVMFIGWIWSLFRL